MLKIKQSISILVLSLVVLLEFSPTLIFASEISGDFPSTVFISELMPAPNEGDEWVELCNPGIELIDISNWMIDDAPDGSSPFSIPESTGIEPQSCLVFTFTNKLNNNGDEVRLINMVNEVVDGFAYSSSIIGKSYLRINNLDWQINGDPNPGEYIKGVSKELLENLESTIQLLSVPSIIKGNQEFNVSIKLTNLKPVTEYSIKLLAGFDSTKLIDAKTFNNTESYAWNAGWDNFPIIKTDKNGNAQTSIKGIAKNSDEYDSIYVSARIRAKQFSKNIDSEVLKIDYVGTLSDKDSLTEQDDPKSIENVSLIDDVRDLEEGLKVKVKGTVSSEFGELGAKTFYIQDESGGIKIVSRHNEHKNIVRERVVEVIGEVGTAFNEKYIKITELNDVKDVGEGDLPDALPLPTGNIAEDYEGELVHIVGQVAATSGNTFYLDDGSGPARVYIKDSTNIDKPYMRTGYYSAITGIVSQYLDDYRVMPRTQEDVIVSKTPIATVLGQAITQLPATAEGFGHSFWIGSTVVLVGVFMRLVLFVFNRRLTRLD